MAITDWISAVGTLVMALVAIVAIFQDKIRAWLMRPRLRVSISVAPPDCQKTKMRYSLPSPDVNAPARERMADVYYFRLRVSNSGNQKAESVEVFVAQLSRQQADGSFRVVDSFLPMNLVWAHLGGMLFPAIAPGTYKHCDLGYILDPQSRKMIPGEHTTWPNVPPDKTILTLDTVVKPYTLSYLLPFGTYHLVILVAAANAKAIKNTLEVRVTGDWYDDEREMLGQGIGIRLLH